MGKQKHQTHQKLRDQVRQHMFFGNAPFAVPQLFRGPDVSALLELQHLRSNHPRKGRPVGQRNTQNHAG